VILMSIVGRMHKDSMRAILAHKRLNQLESGAQVQRPVSQRTLMDREVKQRNALRFFGFTRRFKAALFTPCGR
jgi:hypothetical protein